MALKENTKSYISTGSSNTMHVISKFVSKWHYFLLSILLFLILAFIKIKYTVPVYNISASIAISQDESINDAGLSAFKDLGTLDNNVVKIENEIKFLQSRTLISSVVRKLDLNIQYFLQGSILNTELYDETIIEFNFLDEKLRDNHESIVTYNVKINSETSYSFVEGEQVLSTHTFGNKIKTVLGEIIVTPISKNIKDYIGQVVIIKVTPIKETVESYKRKLFIFQAGQNSSVVNIGLNNPIKEKAVNIINSLIDEYILATIKNKKRVSEKTAKFIKERIKLISGDLSEVDNEAAGYKSKFGLTNNVDAQTQMVAAIDSENAQKIGSLQTQLSLLASMKRFITSEEAKNDPIPPNLGFDNPTISSDVARYNRLIFQRKRLLKTSSEKNPVVINVTEQIEGVRQILISSLKSLRSSIKIRLNSLQTQDKYFSGKLYSAPIRQKDLREIEREQTVKEQLYLYLLKKREEAEITGHVTVADCRIIDRASVLSSKKVSPKRLNHYAGGFLIGFLIPFLIIYLKELFNSKIDSVDDLEASTDISIVGTIPRFKKRKDMIIKDNDRSQISEAFRILRTNIDFLLKSAPQDSAKTILVTSSISGEGKTYTSFNLSKVLSFLEGRVIHVTTDFRDPKLNKYLDLPKEEDQKGFTNFIVNKNLKPHEVIEESIIQDNIDILRAGKIPPNPSELLVDPRVSEMFDYLKKNYDYIIMDSAPVKLVTDTLLLEEYIDLTLFIVRESYTEKKLIKNIEKLKAEKRLPNIAILLNGEEDKPGNYGYGYGNNN